MTETNIESLHKHDLVATRIVDLISKNPDYSLADIRKTVGETYPRRIAKGDAFNYILKRILEELVFQKLDKEQRTLLREKEIVYERELIRKSRIDELTGLYRRGYFLERVDEEIAKNPHMKVLMIDLDYLKDCNDTYGHSSGDEALKALADLMHKSFAEYALFGRWGGEEFVMAIPDSLTDFESRLQNFRNNYRSFCGLRFTGQTCRFQGTMSTGIYEADFSRGQVTIEEAINFADDALYEAKKERNRVIVWNPNLLKNPKRK